MIDAYGWYPQHSRRWSQSAGAWIPEHFFFFPQPQRSFSKNNRYWCLPLRFKPKYPPTTKPSAISSVTKWTQTSKRRRATKTDMTLSSTANGPTKLQQRRVNRVQVITRTHHTMCSLHNANALAHGPYPPALSVLPAQAPMEVDAYASTEGESRRERERGRSWQYQDRPPSPHRQCYHDTYQRPPSLEHLRDDVVRS